MKKITVMLFVLSLFGLFSTSMIAQNTTVGMPKKVIVKNQFQQMAEDHDHIADVPGPDGVVRCATDQYEAMLQRQNPDRQTREEFEAWLAPKIAQIKADKAAGRNVQTVYNIPVVIHVIHNGDAIGTGENISDAQAASQIQVLNNDFRRLMGTPGYNTDPAGADLEVNFCLAQQTPTGVASTGVEHLNINPPNNVGAAGDWETTADINVMKGTTIWDTSRYMNFWSVRFGGNTSANGGTSDLLGYAQFPNGSSLGDLPGNDGGANNNTDGAVCKYNAFGNKNDPANSGNTFIMDPTYNLGRTMTHEVGHWLGLYHTFQGGCTGVGDRCNDTPAVATPNFGCATGTNSCPSAAGNDMVANYMDYSDDACMNIFTADQKIRVQAVMASAQRRASLNASTVCQTATPIIKFGSTTGSINENTNCNFTDVTFPVYIGKAPSQAATITFTATGTATTALDYQIMTASLNFPTGSTAAQNMTVRVFHDGLVEGAETINVSLVLNANGGDATLDPVAKDIVITIADNDTTPTATINNTILTEDFEDLTGWTSIDADGDTNEWGTVTGAEGIGAVMGACGFSETDLTIVGGTGTATPNNFLITPQVTIPVGSTSATLKYDIGYYSAGSGAGEHYAVYFTTNPATPATIMAGTVLQADTITPANFTTAPKTHNLITAGIAGQTGYFVFRHIANASGDGIILLDNLDISSVIATAVQTTVNTPTAYTALIPQTGTAHPKDSTTGNMMMDITDSDNFNYGCATVSVSRDATTAGAATVNYGTNTATDLKVMAKSFTVATANANPTGSSTLKFYFTEAEIAAWEAGTGNVRANMKVLKQGGGYTNATIGAFGAGVTLTTTVATGANGVYFFGKAPLPTVSFAAATGNPTEATDCSFTDYTYAVLLDLPASADATVTFNVTGGTATATKDYQIVNPSVTFLAGTTTTQNLTVRVFNDGIVEANETINVSLVLNANGGDAVLDPATDDMVITITDNDVAPIATTTIQDVVNTPTAYNATINATGTAHAIDSATGNVILSLTDNDNFDYGCATVSVSRDAATAGAPSVNFGTNTALNLQVMAKTFTVATANANATGSATTTFYFSESDIAAWETATGNVRADLKVVKTGETLYSSVTIGTFGATGVTLTASTSTGAAGEYNFGIDANPTISFDAATGNIAEATDCTFTDVTFPISILTGATADATVTFNVTGGTATATRDYQIVNPSVTFLAGTTTPQDLTIRVFNDGIVEANETINVSLVLNANGGDAVLDAAADDMVITITDNDVAPIATTTIQDAVNTPTAYTATINATGTAHAIDNVSGNVMLSLTDNDNFDYGCSTISVSRDAATAGAPSVNFGTNTALNLQVMAKTFTVATANVNATGSATNTFYFSEADIAAWETATGNVRADLKVIKTGETVYSAATLGSFGATGVTLTASTATGAAGEYNFGATVNPKISFDAATGIIAEATNCNFTDVTFPISIDGPSSANADITFNVTGGTATAGDYQIIPASVTFTTGSTTSQNMTVRVFHDGLVEGAETINVSLVLNANGGDAILDATKQDMVITVNDDDLAPTAGGTVSILSEDFEAVPGWGVIDGDGDTHNWGTVTGAAGIGSVAGACGFSETDLSLVGGTGTATPNNYIITPQVTIPAGATIATMNYDIGYATQGTGAGEHYAVYFTTDATSEASILAGTVLQADTITPANFTTAPISHDLVAAGLVGQTGFFVLRHIANPSGDGIILLDNMEISATTSGAVVQVGVNTPTAYVAGVTGTGTAYATDSATGNIMLSLTDNDGFNYGCTTVSVSRDQATAGAPSVNFGANTAANLRVMAKNFTVAATANASGSVGFTFYLKEAEVAAWETATGLTRADLKVIKTGTTTYYPATIGAFGSDVTLTATIPSGADGVYNFGQDPALSTSTFELNNNISIYPNPTKDVLNISTTSDFGLPTSYTVYSALGQVLKTVNKVSQADLTINTASYSNGVYFIKIEKDGTFITKKFIKN
ncbi:MAG: Calx-beta domain-containing protein [Bacteroidota bacterium]